MSSQESQEPTSYDKFYHVRLFNHGSLYARSLYDVDGFLLQDEEGNKLNVYTQAMNEAFISKKIRLIHKVSEPGYSYFVTSEEQYRRFEFERENGSRERTLYHVYADEDVNWQCYDCSRVFINPQK